MRQKFFPSFFQVLRFSVTLSKALIVVILEYVFPFSLYEYTTVVFGKNIVRVPRGL